MIKIMFCLRRNPALSVEEFQDYWRNRHAPIVMKHAARLGMLRYVQSHSLHNPAFAHLSEHRGHAVEPFDGVAECWYASERSLTRTSDNIPAAILAASRELLEDERAFIDMDNSPIFVVQEREIIPFTAQ